MAPSVWIRGWMRILTTSLMILMCIVIFFFSSENAEKSDRTSGRISLALIRIFSPGYDQKTEAEQEEIYNLFQTIVRKGAHFTEYLLLGLLIRLCYQSWFGERFHPKTISWITGTLYAVTDELHQILSEGRNGQIADVGIDSFGVFIGVLIGALVVSRINRVLKKGKTSMPMNIVLVHPEIPQNTGNIVRTCAATGSVLHLIEPLGFSLEDRYLKRAGLDYWRLMRYYVYRDLESFWAKNRPERFFLASTKAGRSYDQVKYRDGDFFFFGCETRGLSETFLAREYDKTIRIPMNEAARSLNLSNSVAVILYEALRQNRFAGMKAEGELTGRPEKAEPWLDYI